MTETATRERLHRLEASVARSVDLLEVGRVEEAREELLRAVAADAVPAAAPTDEPLSEQEFERAFDAAEPEVDQMIDADRVAQVALRQAGADELHVEGEGEDDLAAEEGALPEGFATATMAELLERQGDTDGASRIRAALSTAPPGQGPPALEDASPEGDVEASRPSRGRVIRTLERWLENVREARA